LTSLFQPQKKRLLQEVFEIRSFEHNNNIANEPMSTGTQAAKGVGRKISREEPMENKTEK